MSKTPLPLSQAPPERLRVAICGGGIAGISLAVGLSKLPHIDAQLFEGAETFKERGAGVGLAVNAQTALEMTDPDLRKALDLAGAVRMQPSAKVMLGSGPHAGEHVADIDPVPETTLLTVHRYEFLEQILKLVPPEITHVNKKLVRVDESGPKGPVTLHFEDGTTHEADALIGTDGIHSVVRKQILGVDHPACVPQFGGCYVYWQVVPMKEIRARLGDKYLDQQCQMAWFGDDGFLMTDVVSGGVGMQVIAAKAADTWDEASPWVQWPKQRPLQDFATWGEWGRAFSEFVSEQPNVAAMAIYEHRDAPTYARDRICVTGDAAHAFTPWQGAGAGQALEDTLVLTRLLAQTYTADDLPSALLAYDHLRRPRTQHIAKTSHAMGVLMTGNEGDVGLDPEKLRGALEGRWDHIMKIDLGRHVEEAVAEMGRLRGVG